MDKPILPLSMSQDAFTWLPPLPVTPVAEQNIDFHTDSFAPDASFDLDQISCFSIASTCHSPFMRDSPFARSLDSFAKSPTSVRADSEVHSYLSDEFVTSSFQGDAVSFISPKTHRTAAPKRLNENQQANQRSSRRSSLKITHHYSPRTMPRRTSGEADVRVRLHMDSPAACRSVIRLD
ncbi:hypothetical protein J8273_6158 [Carpediemonas membranifera]|uniref:Uncharacterized protein n=1 Tax=Carpediemonas membranifera TaxID=201153 RepID=A0A8J6AQR5_9EUKA|nr:hypothetical protein J8273_6153 [Carpediemonas membranifera]KAG9391398.1 hypothetical protein J8273_6158 [Carpediemonas membranifera]|eukprot:KAG9391393.1 hypothetical protein J8273_6153 [Carpediemonas membranifera]